MELDYQKLIEGATMWGVIAMAIVFIVRPLIPVFVEWLRGNIKDGAVSKAYDTAIMTELSVIKNNHLDHVQQALDRIATGQEYMSKTLERVEAKLDRK